MGSEATSTSQTDPPAVPRRLFAIDNQHEKFNNPFFGCDDEATENIAKRVAFEYGLYSEEEQNLFVKAAMALKYPNPDHWKGFDPPLSTHETSALKNEIFTTFWDQPWPLKTTFLMLFVAAIVQGWSETGTNGANLGLPNAFGWNAATSSSVAGGTSNSSPNETRNCIPKGADGWIFAAVNAAPYLCAGISCWFSDPLNELVYGRRGAIAISALLIFASSIGAAFTKGHWGWLFACRALLGVGMGCKAAVVPVFAAEIAPAHLRGSLVMNWQVFDALGIFLGFTANMIASKAGPESAWRWQVSSSCIPAFALLWGTLYICWDSPRFLMKKEMAYGARHDRLVDKYQDYMSDHIDRGSGSRRTPTIELELASQTSHTENVRFRRRKTCDFQPRQHQMVVPKFLYRSKFFPKSLRKSTRPGVIEPYTSPAFRTLLLLRGEPILAAKELLFAHCQLLIELQQDESPGRPVQNDADAAGNDDMDFSLASRTSWFKQVGHLFALGEGRFAYIRREALAAATVMISQQSCGINVLIFYSSTLFCNAGSGQESSASLQPLLLSWGLGAINFVFAYPAYTWIDRRGRQWLLLITLPVLASFIGMAALGFGLTHWNPQTDERKAVVFVFTILFTAVYSFGMGPVPFTYSAEIFPLEHRMVGMSFAVSVNMLGAGLLALFVPKISPPWMLLTVFAGLNLVAFCLVWLYVREVAGYATKRRGGEGEMTGIHLEQLFYIFRIPRYLHHRYQSQQFRPYFLNTIKNFFLRGKAPTEPTPFYRWALPVWQREVDQNSARPGSREE